MREPPPKQLQKGGGAWCAAAVCAVHGRLLEAVDGSWGRAWAMHYATKGGARAETEVDGELEQLLRRRRAAAAAVAAARGDGRAIRPPSATSRA
eukprot:gene26381-11662_t